MSEETGQGEGAIVFIDAALDEERIGELSEALGRPVRVVSPAGLDLEALCEGAAALVVPWSLQGQPGLDLVETLQRSGRADQIRIVMTSPQPTRARVLAALRAGADSFAFEPYEPSELQSRIPPASEPAPDA